MVKPEWGTKRTCPKTGERFFDLGRDNPVRSPSGFEWYPEPILKSRQLLPLDAARKESADDEKANVDSDLGDGIDIDEGEGSADDDTDLGGDEDLGVSGRDENDEN